MFKGVHSIVNETAEVIWFVADEHAAAAMIQGKIRHISMLSPQVLNDFPVEWS
jgi:hypothetical protein